jgi:hypothetical protein
LADRRSGAWTAVRDSVRGCPTSACRLLGGLSVAADLGFALPPEEAMRPSLIATSLARRQGLADEEVADTFYTALLMARGM